MTKYDAERAERARRNLNPHAEAIYAMSHFSAKYVAQNGGSMDFWDQVPEQDKRWIRDVVARIRAAKPETAA